MYMDRRKWMYDVECANPEYIKGLSEFTKLVEDHRANTGEARISCTYTCWERHGDAKRDCNNVISKSNVNNNDDSGDDICGSSNQNINDMLHDAEHNTEIDMDKLQKLLIESQKPLYNVCTNFTKLSVVLHLLNLKAEYGMSDVCFNKLSELLNKMLLKHNELPTSTYKAKKIDVSVGIGSHKNKCTSEIL
ncbi:hypothetical protein CTI12_AA350020 [Artemisia annua]|uniref:Uncharacterized protein n=1 Tax=Artemisia annua TaxID=35608 RepID=A0A2U1MR47_ARTAN|nr:hypothetical protein CTI12_AA350020 [Artemisia annua]